MWGTMEIRLIHTAKDTGIIFRVVIGARRPMVYMVQQRRSVERLLRNVICRLGIPFPMKQVLVHTVIIVITAVKKIPRLGDF